MLILIFLQLSHSKLCADYSCSIVPLNFASQCIEKVGYTYTLGTCNEEYYSYCPPSYTDSFCQLPPVPSDINIAVPGEPCEFDRNCLNSICQQSFCKGYPMGLMCNQDTQCDVGLYCDSINNYCTAQVSAGNACSRDEECTNSCGCFNGNCKNYFTLVSGTVLETCINGRNLLCLSGACQSYLNVNYCVKQETSLGVLPILCANDGDCEVSSNFTYSTGCACGYNEFGYSYCNLAPGDSLFLNYTLALQEWVSSSNISLCHTTARMDLQCIGAHWNYTNYINLAFYQSAVMNYPLVQGNDICIQEIYTNSYWEIKEIFDEINEPSPVNDFAFYFIGTSLMESKSKKSDGINLKPYSSNEETKALPIVPRPTDSKKPIRNTPPVKQLRPIGKSQNSALNSSNPKNKPLPTKGKIPTSIKSTVQVKRPESNTSEITKLQENIAKNNRTISDLRVCFEENKKMLRELKDARKNVANEENIEMQLIRSLLLNEELEMILNQGLEDFDEEYTYEELLQLGDQIGKVSKGLSEEQISLLPSEVLKTPENCSICLVDMSVRSLATRLSPCGHLYHIECIKTWLTENKTCPLCLQEITI